MEVLFDPKKDPHSVTVTCQTCKCVLELKKEDVSEADNILMAGAEGPHVGHGVAYTCPQCNCKHVLTAANAEKLMGNTNT